MSAASILSNTGWKSSSRVLQRLSRLRAGLARVTALDGLVAQVDEFAGNALLAESVEAAFEQGVRVAVLARASRNCDCVHGLVIL
jgi:hypothetical protein